MSEFRDNLAHALHSMFGRHYMPSDEQWDRYAQNLINDGLVADPTIVERVEALADELEAAMSADPEYGWAVDEIRHGIAAGLRAALTTPTPDDEEPSEHDIDPAAAGLVSRLTVGGVVVYDAATQKPGRIYIEEGRAVKLAVEHGRLVIETIPPPDNDDSIPGPGYPKDEL